MKRRARLPYATPKDLHALTACRWHHRRM